MFKSIRILILLLILLGVAMASWRAQSAAVSWKYTLAINVYPINGDGSAVAEAYARNLTKEEFAPIEQFMLDEAARYGRSGDASVEVHLRPMLAALPPAPPINGNLFEVIVRSLNLRWWSYRHADAKGPGPQISLFVLYFDPAKHAQLDHSTALQKGLIGRVNVFASREMSGQNNVIIAHEFLHTLGASDKYDLATNLPIFPLGYAEPQRLPLLPQTLAEIMGGRVPVTPTMAHIPSSLNEVVIGKITALEINWLH